jgi:hypothetical protein
MKQVIKIIATNWINILGIFIVSYLYSFVNSYAGASFTIGQALLSSVILIGFYGIVFWIGFCIAIFVFDLILFGFAQNNLLGKLLIEWILISGFFIYWAFKYQVWIFLFGVVAFLLTQPLRRKMIFKIISRVEN